MDNILLTNITSLKGVGPKTASILNSMDIYNIRDVLFNIPYKVVMSAQFSSNLNQGDRVVTSGIIENRVVTQFYENKKSRSYFSLQTPNGSVKIIFFNQMYLKKHLIEGKEVVVKGIYNSSNNTITANSISNASKDTNSNDDSIEVSYHLKQGVTQKKYRELVENCFNYIKDKNIINFVPENFKGIWPLKKILYTLHFPENSVSFDKAKKMFAFHELFDYQLKLQLQSISSKVEDKDYQILLDKSDIDYFISSLAFDLTNSQKDVIEEIFQDLSLPYSMNRLLQGDVGCGKTVVAAALIYGVVKRGYQSAIMAPTEILANQHFDTFFEFFRDLDVSLALLTSSTPKKERTKILELLKAGEIDILIGTHSLIQGDVEFNDLKFVITDEQHRFGVNQRKTFLEKGKKVNSLMMTATPIPRSLAITLITDIKVSTINELPHGRKKVQTYKATSKQLKSVLDNITLELEKNRQGYVVCPLIEESEKIDLKNVEEMYEKITSHLDDKYKVAILHGKMSNKEKDYIVEQFIKGEIHILISTTVIEVGVNVPNATFMLIVDANRFGLATLHQLRGRVGRSSYQSYCVLICDGKNERVDIMCLENDGFKIAEFDLKQRGPGDFFGTKQSGIPSFKAANLLNDTELMYLAKKLAYKIVEVTDNKEKLLSYLGIEKNNF
ncbi:ATP-dependent DNA helicase RecG [Gemella sp. GH3]|uniref:ATP-dependent DNA helicase RecG n=1 Tax=unclassified Gemella TaxID=2624949 RepID=UPI0015CFE253|nr:MULTISPECIES: ATP-dependent DNA helicase RecG [unclassified Gemella]MBF0714300.1 ATP-dependent DNA helicase RecG [Gemella sp. GH3.1]NYS51252.1 ATP-dependent DNA helicase RecG [Gemella sp. GH3]